MCSRGATMGATCMLLKTNAGVSQFFAFAFGRVSALSHTYAHARAREIIELFRFEQQQMGNWPINCCDDLGMPSSARSF